MVKIEFSRARTNDKALLLCVDERYEVFAFAVIDQIASNAAYSDFEICLVAQYQIELPMSLQHLDVRLGQIQIAKPDIHFPLNHHVGFAGYVGLFAITALSAEYDRVVFLDADMMFCGGDLQTLFEVPLLQDHVLGAVRDRFQQRQLDAFPKEAKNLSLPYFPYFNSGMFVVDAEKWLSRDMMDRILATIDQHGHAFAYTDQSALNLTLRGEWTELSWVWNFIYKPELLSHIDSVAPSFIHFAGREKPWFSGCHFHPSWIRTHYEIFLKRHYDLPLIDPPEPIKSPMNQPRYRQFWRNLRAHFMLRRYQRRLQESGQTLDPWKL